MNTQLQKFGEIRSQEGEVLYSIWLNPNGVAGLNGQNFGKENPEGQGGPENQDSDQNKGHQPMTDAQKRYLFRLLADRGIEGEAAYTHLKQTFAVDSIKKITKFDASRAIDRMVNE